MHTSRTLFALTLTTAALAAATPSRAQSLLLPPSPDKGVWLETTYTDFKEADFTFPSTVTYLAARLPLRSGLSAVVDLPFSHARVEVLDETETSTVIGNPFVGVDYAAARSVGVSLGARLPLTNADEESFADVMAFASDPLRGEAFLMDVVPVYAAATYTRALSPAVSLRARAGGTGLFLTETVEEDQDDFEATLDYGVSSTYTTGNGRLSLGLTGRWLATEGEGSYGDNSVHQLGAAGDVLVGGVRPGVSIRLPLDSDYRDLMNASVGVYLQIPLR